MHGGCLNGLTHSDCHSLLAALSQGERSWELEGVRSFVLLHLPSFNQSDPPVLAFTLANLHHKHAPSECQVSVISHTSPWCVAAH